MQRIWKHVSLSVHSDWVWVIELWMIFIFILIPGFFFYNEHVTFVIKNKLISIFLGGKGTAKSIITVTSESGIRQN